MSQTRPGFARPGWKSAARRGRAVPSVLTAALVGAAVLVECSPPSPNTTGPEDPIAALQVSSAAFANEGDIPARHTCDADDVSPPLSWSAGPRGTRSYALIMEDPDAPLGTWVHWVAWNMEQTRLGEGVTAQAPAPAQGVNSGNQVGYTGPCPPRPTGAHRYIFRVYALDARLVLPEPVTRDHLLQAMEGHVLAKGELMGRYARP